MEGETYMIKTASVPYSKGLFIGPAPENMDELEEIAQNFHIVIDLRYLSNEIKEAETDGLSYQTEESELKARGIEFVVCPFPDTKHLIPYGRASIAQIKRAWELAINKIMAGKKVLVHAGKIEDNFNRVSLIAILYMSAVYGHIIEQCVSSLKKSVPRAEIDKKFVDLAKSLTGQIRRS